MSVHFVLLDFEIAAFLDYLDSNKKIYLNFDIINYIF